MTSRLSYMGTKHDLAGNVAEVIAGCRPGRLLDAFAGMGAVAEAHAGTRPVWTNDVQHFAYLASRCRFIDPAGPVASARMRNLVMPLYQQNRDILQEQNQCAWSATEELTDAETYLAFQRRFNQVSRETISHEGAYGCFTASYANAYFSLVQCADIDSIRCALDTLRGRGTLTQGEFDWALLALGHAAQRVANTTGHFAQFLTPSARNFTRVARQFKRSAFNQWLVSLDAMEPSGTAEWRSSNLATRSDCQTMLKSLSSTEGVGVVYCDPPYTADHYSRFYHVWETLVLNDYPEVIGTGRYRPDRFTTPFSLKRKVADAFQTLVSQVAATGADLVLSYPTNGLLHDTGVHPLDVLRSVYPGAALVAQIDHSHSTMGASKGSATASVAECLYVGRA